MTPADEAELHRLTRMLSQVEGTLPPASPLREAVQKSALALFYAFLDGHRSELEQMHRSINADLTDAQRAHLRSLGIDPGADSSHGAESQ